jgi:alpha-galactosidase
MKGLVDYIHDKGLRAGIYSSPGPLTCGNFEGSYKHELQDAQTYSEWGFDYLKYDVCSYNLIYAEESNPGPTNKLEKPLDKKSPEYRAVLQKPWRVMREALDTLDRDLVYSISGNVRDWGPEVGANSWRVSSDVVDSWLEIVSGWRIPVSEIAFDRFREGERKGFSGPELAGPGHFNDRDMLVVGQVGWGGKQHPTRLTPNEQYTHISMWCLLASPLMIGCDMTKLDDFTLNLLTNDEVIEVNQDPLGKQAVRVSKDGDREVWAKEMEDGSKAVGLFNRGYLPAKVEIPWKTLGLAGPQIVRDLWRQKNLGMFDAAFSAEVPRHGVVLVKVTPAPTNTPLDPQKGKSP